MSARRIVERSAAAAFAALVLVVGCGGDDDAPRPADVLSGNPNGANDGEACAEGFDCKSGVCVDLRCATPTSTDGVRNGDETGLDCGGTTAPRCAGGQACFVETDCASNVCDRGVCTALECGAAAPIKCPVGLPCAAPDDCDTGVCASGACQAPKPDDGVKNGDETDVDCGGSSGARCADGKGCGAGDDCMSGVCKGGACAAPTGTDGVKNGDESDVDCGGTTPGTRPCAAGKACNRHEDCASDGCNAAKKCAVARSCTAVDGGETCGSGEVGQAGAQHESCCLSLPIPGRTTRLDKYKVTAGRMRAFIERTNGDVLDWYTKNKGTLSAAARAQIEPYTAYLPQDLTSYPYGANYQLGGTIILPQEPSPFQGCFAGNAANPTANGSHTYDNGTFEGEDRGFDRAFLDRLPLNCVAYPLMAAFCAWDGGRLQTYEENSAAYGAGTYPWGATPQAGGFASVGGVWTRIGPATNDFTSTPCPTCDVTRMNWRNNHQFPVGGNPDKPWDYAYWISAPGRFVADAGPGGHRDIGGLMMELTATFNGSKTTQNYDGNNVNQPRVRWSRAGSWEGHAANYTGWLFPIMTKYGKVGGRCARD